MDTTLALRAVLQLTNFFLPVLILDFGDNEGVNIFFSNDDNFFLEFLSGLTCWKFLKRYKVIDRIKF